MVANSLAWEKTNPKRSILQGLCGLLHCNIVAKKTLETVVVQKTTGRTNEWEHTFWLPPPQKVPVKMIMFCYQHWKLVQKSISLVHIFIKGKVFCSLNFCISTTSSCSSSHSTSSQALCLKTSSCWVRYRLPNCGLLASSSSVVILQKKVQEKFKADDFRN